MREGNKVEESERELIIRRILVALDASTHSLAALEAAAGLAASQGAELIGLFVEDENLVHLAGLPFAHEVRSPSATRRPMSSDQMEAQLQLQASQARRALASAAERVNARWRFRTVRGQVTASVLSAALDADMLAMGRISRPVSSRSRLGSTARAASLRTKGPLLLMKQGSNLSYPVLVTYDGTTAAHQALATAAQMAMAGGDHLSVLLIADSAEQAQTLRDDVANRLAALNVSARYHWLPQATVERVADMIHAAEDCVLVLGGENPLLEAEAIQNLLDATDCPVLLVR
jgi:nucleotide-binding universal stress UspA family protein